MISLTLRKRLQGPSGEMLLDVEMEIPAGKLITLFGPSGAGKTSILRMFAGLLAPDYGHIEVDGVTWYDHGKRIILSPQKRRVGFVFQDYALFPNMTVRQNIEYGLPKRYEEEYVASLIRMTGLSDLEHRRPSTLSGGQQQRVALARAMAARPRILLLDEPFSAVDQAMRSEMQEYILALHTEYAPTILLVSHEAGEIFRMSERIFQIEEGKVTKFGTPGEIFSNLRVSGKFQFTGEVVAIEKQGIIFIVTLSIGSSLVKVVADEAETRGLVPGDKVMVASKAFNPIIEKIR